MIACISTFKKFIPFCTKNPISLPNVGDFSL
jgi:hypothetical protein